MTDNIPHIRGRMGDWLEKRWGKFSAKTRKCILIGIVVLLMVIQAYIIYRYITQIPDYGRITIDLVK